MTSTTGIHNAANSVWAVLAVIASVLAVMAFITTVPADLRYELISEGGPVETVSAVGFGICIAMIWWLWPAQQVRERWYFTVFLALFAMRELDLDKRPFTEGLLNARQYTGDTVGTLEFIISAAILIAILASCFFIVRRETGRLLRGLRAGDVAAIAFLAGLVLLVFCKSIDGIGRKLAPFGVETSAELSQQFTAIEEVGELGIPMLFALAILVTPRTRTAARNRS